ncbi:hypothetical protein TTRE_0000666001 [Trichuris trichiura]|uniref:Uncharacterized protein n=1 Tax=Trichuris trichiura TaxID=36087 RepID=A0A077ZIC9_TRITR|nr:hypothetical protein TTRE_0000666001 [Trichuris trichiura]
MAFQEFKVRWLRDGETPDAFLAGRRRLAQLAGGVSETALASAFVDGLLEPIQESMRAGARMESLTLDELLTHARAMLARGLSGCSGLSELVAATGNSTSVARSPGKIVRRRAEQRASPSSAPSVSKKTPSPTVSASGLLRAKKSSGNRSDTGNRNAVDAQIALDMNEAHMRPNREAQSMLMGAPEAETSPAAAEAMAKVCGEERESTRTAAKTSDAAVTSAQDPADEPCPKRSTRLRSSGSRHQC